MARSSLPARPHPPRSSRDSDSKTTSPLGRKAAPPKELGLQVGPCRAPGAQEEAGAPRESRAGPVITSHLPKTSASPAPRRLSKAPGCPLSPAAPTSCSWLPSSLHPEPPSRGALTESFGHPVLSSPSVCPLIGLSLPWGRAPQLVTPWPSHPARPTREMSGDREGSLTEEGASQGTHATETAALPWLPAAFIPSLQAPGHQGRDRANEKEPGTCRGQSPLRQDWGDVPSAAAAILVFTGRGRGAS